MGRLYLVSDQAEIERRRKRLDSSRLVEVWQDLYTDGIFWMGDDEARRIAYGRLGKRRPSGLFWMGEESKAALNSEGEPLPVLMALPGDVVPIYYGPGLSDTESLPTEESLRARVLSGHGIGVAWATYDVSGGRNEYQPTSPTDPTFYLRRPRGATVHLWRLFRTKGDALTYVRQHLAGDAEATRWAERLPADDFDDLLARFGEKPS